MAMNMTSIFEREVFRPIAITLVPGTIALTPFIFLFHNYFPNVYKILSNQPTITGLLLILISIAVGLILEDVGSLIEVIIWYFVKESDDDDNNWYKYLRVAFKSEPIGNKYIGNIVLRMKFENSFAPALVLLCCGIVWLRILDQIKSSCLTAWLVLVLFLVAIFLIYESYSSAKLLKRLRKELLNGVIEL